MVNEIFKYFKHNRWYYIAQVSGWVVFTLVHVLFYKIALPLELNVIVFYLSWLFIGFLISHIYRFFLKKFLVIQKPLYIQIALTLISPIFLSYIFFNTVQGIGCKLGVLNSTSDNTAFLDVSGYYNFYLVFLIWNVGYFGVNYVINYRKEEITELKLEAANREVELNILKSQLNPHFLFNALNSIRALIDENPQKSREAITQLSNILRNILSAQKNKEIHFEDEISIVQDYLSLEKIRYEERLNYSFEIDPKTLQFSIPPLMIQTLVENAIKHGIAKQPKGGHIRIHSRLAYPMWFITIINTGKIQNNENKTNGIGIKNTLDRLQLLYGNNAYFKLEQVSENEVLAEIVIKLNDTE
ncbi:MAG: histidine kinase [Bacteroidia bacterium]|nr:MAG: histidine kinase [Bacteroidia bacterium]